MKLSRLATALLLCLFCPLMSLAAPGVAEANAPVNLQLADSKAPAKPAEQSKAPQKAVASKSQARKSAEVIATRLPPAQLDLSLPQDLVEELTPPNQVISRPRKRILPPLFDDKADSPYQLNGRLISNEMQLQLRNEARHDIEGAAIELEYKH
ncbi:hypothetical protein D3C76_814380 [compost metagenome]